MSLVSILKSVNKGFLKDALTGAGVTLATSGSVLIAINALVDKLRDTTTGMPPQALAFMHLAGIDIAMSMILGAIVGKHVISSSNLMLKKISP